MSSWRNPKHRRWNKKVNKRIKSVPASSAPTVSQPHKIFPPNPFQANQNGIYQQEEDAGTARNLVAYGKLEAKHGEEQDPAEWDVHQCLATPVGWGEEPWDPQLGTSSCLGRHRFKGWFIVCAWLANCTRGNGPRKWKGNKICHHRDSGVEFNLF